MPVQIGVTKTPPPPAPPVPVPTVTVAVAAFVDVTEVFEVVLTVVPDPVPPAPPVLPTFTEQPTAAATSTALHPSNQFIFISPPEGNRPTSREAHILRDLAPSWLPKVFILPSEFALHAADRTARAGFARGTPFTRQVMRQREVSSAMTGEPFRGPSGADSSLGVQRPTERILQVP